MSDFRLARGQRATLRRGILRVKLLAGLLGFPRQGVERQAQSDDRCYGAIIRYAVNGGEPTTASPIYRGPIVISWTTTISARAYKTGLAPMARRLAR